MSGHNYTTKVITKESKKGCWNTTVIEIYDGDKKIGKYKRNYPHYGEETFHPFQIDNKWYALYSKRYDETRVMTLPNCKDWCGETAEHAGFCPTEFYVPEYKKFNYDNGKGLTFEYHDFGNDIDEECDRENYTLDYVKSTPFAFLSGCHWGDDSSWKIQYLDLSQVPKKILKRDSRFGYLEMCGDMTLKESIDMEHWEEDCGIVTINSKKTYDIETGKEAD